MMMLIIFIILAVLALVFLVAFNMRASSNQKKNHQIETEIETPTTPMQDSAQIAAEAPETVAEKPASHTGTDVIQERSEEHSVKEIRTITKNKNEMMDQEYRNALKQFQLADGEGTDEIPESAAKHMKDTEYRDALRSIYKSKQPNRLTDKEK
jgi:cell division protein FtsX